MRGFFLCVCDWVTHHSLTLYAIFTISGGGVWPNWTSSLCAATVSERCEWFHVPWQQQWSIIPRWLINWIKQNKHEIVGQSVTEITKWLSNHMVYGAQTQQIDVVDVTRQRGVVTGLIWSAVNRGNYWCPINWIIQQSHTISPNSASCLVAADVSQSYRHASFSDRGLVMLGQNGKPRRYNLGMGKFRSMLKNCQLSDKKNT